MSIALDIAFEHMLRGGQIATVLPDRIEREHEELHLVRLEPPVPARTVVLLRRKGAYRTAASKAFVRLLLDSFEDGR